MLIKVNGCALFLVWTIVSVGLAFAQGQNGSKVAKEKPVNKAATKTPVKPSETLSPALLRSIAELRASWGVGVTRTEFREKVQKVATEIELAKDEIRDSKLLGLLQVNLEFCKIGLTAWGNSVSAASKDQGDVGDAGDRLFSKMMRELSQSSMNRAKDTIENDCFAVSGAYKFGVLYDPKLDTDQNRSGQVGSPPTPTKKAVGGE